MTNDEYKALLEVWHCLGGIHTNSLPQYQQASIAENYTRLRDILREGRPRISDALAARGIVDTE
jgi:hypothetical protein